MLLEALQVMRDLPRLRELASILIRYGFGDLVRRAGVGSVLVRAGELLASAQVGELKSHELPVRVRLALEAMGPTFVKFGQIMSTRVDLFSAEWIAEFEKLQAGVAPIAFEEIRDQITESLGRAPEDVFQELETHAYAAASIAQVHRAKLPDGTRVILKVRRPGIRAKIEADLRIVSMIAAVAEREIPELARFQPVQMVAEFGRSLDRELDLAQEARSQTRFAKNFENDPNVQIPKIFWEYTSTAMNVQQYVEGVPGNDLPLVDRAGLDRKILAERGAAAVLKMMLIDGYFHADPHPGNVLYLPGNRLCLLDFGMVGRLSEYRRDQIVDLLAALGRRDERGMMNVLIDWTADAQVDENKLANDLGELAFNYEHLQLKDINISTLIGDITAIMRTHAIVLPSDLTLLFKALITLEGLGRQLNPDFRLVEYLRPFVRQIIVTRYKPQTLALKWRHRLLDAVSTLGEIPGDIARILRDARRGRIKIELDLKRLDHFGHQLDKSANRLTVGVVTAALIVGSSIVMTVRGGPELLGLPLFGLLGFLVAAINSFWLIWSIGRSNKDK